MISRKIQDLSTADLDYLDTLLHQEFSRQAERSATWKSKNHYTDPRDQSNTLRRLMSAVHSQKQLSMLDKW